MRSPRILPAASVRTASRSRSGAILERARRGNAGQHIADAVPPRQRRFELNAQAAETSAARQHLHVLGAHFGIFRECRTECCGRMNLRELPHPRVVGIQHGDPVRRQRFDQFALGPRHAFDAIRESSPYAPSRRSSPRRSAVSRSAPARESRPRGSCPFEHRHLAVVRQAQNRQRHAQMIVEIADRPAGSELPSQAGVAMVSFVVVLPALPVTPITVPPQRSRAACAQLLQRDRGIRHHQLQSRDDRSLVPRSLPRRPARTPAAT